MNRKNLRKQLPICTRTAMILLLAASAALLPAACSPLPDDDALPSADGNTSVALGIASVTIDGAETTTRADNTTISSGWLWVGCRKTPGYNALDWGTTYICTDGVWADSNVYYYMILDSRPISLYAYYPFVEGKDKYSDKVPLTMQVYSEAEDRCFTTQSENTVTAANPKATFLLKHAYTRLRAAISRSDKFTGNSTCTQYGVGVVGTGAVFAVKGTLNAESGAVTSSDASGDYTLGAWDSGDALSITIPPTNTEVIVCDLLMIPQTIPTEGFSLSVVVDGKSTTIPLPPSSFGATSLESNMQYTVHLKMNSGAVITRGKVTVEPWTTETLPEIIDPIEPK